MIIGIDPGMSGAIAFLSDNDEVRLYDMPVLQRNKTKRINCYEVMRILKEHSAAHCYIEQVNAFGMGASSAYNFGWTCGALEACVSAAQIPMTYVAPQKWKKALGLPKDKDAARARVIQMFPRYADEFKLKKHADRAEALLIALWGRNYGVSA